MRRSTVQTAAVALLTGLTLGACVEVDVKPLPEPNLIPLAGDAGPIFGARLAPIELTWSDGSVTFDPVRLWDLERDEACSFVNVAHKGGFCLPPFVFNTKPGWYLDDACTKPVLVTYACENLPRYMRDQMALPSNVCEPKALEKIYVLGEPIPDDVLYSVNPLGNCVKKTGTLGAINVALPIGDGVPLDAFVSVASVNYGSL